ncbi:hypothetical protein GCM10023320_13370 [Pseudonocardia adelaidensis]|uniref:Uncharacterized protein n=1 Tax=Pseudonocardia adelaidensis TaxID=648754 RepID=A0ABP9NDC0_9PSEU
MLVSNTDMKVPTTSTHSGSTQPRPGAGADPTPLDGFGAGCGPVPGVDRGAVDAREAAESGPVPFEPAGGALTASAVPHAARWPEAAACADSAAEPDREDSATRPPP